MVEKRVRRSGARRCAGSSRSCSHARRRSDQSADESLIASTIAPGEVCSGRARGRRGIRTVRAQIAVPISSVQSPNDCSSPGRALNVGPDLVRRRVAVPLVSGADLSPRSVFCSGSSTEVHARLVEQSSFHGWPNWHVAAEPGLNQRGGGRRVAAPGVGARGTRRPVFRRYRRTSWTASHTVRIGTRRRGSTLRRTSRASQRMR